MCQSTSINPSTAHLWTKVLHNWIPNVFKDGAYNVFILCPLKDGIVLGADTRATEGMIVADKNCSKIHYISPNI